MPYKGKISNKNKYKRTEPFDSERFYRNSSIHRLPVRNNHTRPPPVNIPEINNIIEEDKPTESNDLNTFEILIFGIKCCMCGFNYSGRKK